MVIVLYAIITFFGDATAAFEAATVATFNAVETAAEVTSVQLQATTP